MQEKILHAVDLCILGDLHGAKSALEHETDPAAERLLTLITTMQEDRKQREDLQKMGRHELGNAPETDGLLEPFNECPGQFAQAVDRQRGIFDHECAFMLRCGLFEFVLNDGLRIKALDFVELQFKWF